jgi:hypothetical protein
MGTECFIEYKFIISEGLSIFTFALLLLPTTKLLQPVITTLKTGNFYFFVSSLEELKHRQPTMKANDFIRLQEG